MRRIRPARLGRSHARIATGLVLGAALVGAGIALLPAAGARVETRIGHEGTIRLAPDARKQCQRLGFDNRNGEVRDKGVIACDPDADLDSPSSVDRMQAIRAWFNRR